VMLGAVTVQFVPAFPLNAKKAESAVVTSARHIRVRRGVSILAFKF
jgi:hypothetical protein